MFFVSYVLCLVGTIAPFLFPLGVLCSRFYERIPIFYHPPLSSLLYYVIIRFLLCDYYVIPLHKPSKTQKQSGLQVHPNKKWLTKSVSRFFPKNNAISLSFCYFTSIPCILYRLPSGRRIYRIPLIITFRGDTDEPVSAGKSVGVFGTAR